jgi:hypothetical protein
MVAIYIAQSIVQMGDFPGDLTTRKQLAKTVNLKEDVKGEQFVF